MEEIKFEFASENDDLLLVAEQEFTNGTVFTSSAFTGAEIIIVLLAAKDSILKVLGFYNKYRESLKDATVTIGKDSVSLTGYTMGEVEQLLKSGAPEKIIAELKKKDV